MGRNTTQQIYILHEIDEMESVVCVGTVQDLQQFSKRSKASIIMSAIDDRVLSKQWRVKKLEKED